MVSQLGDQNAPSLTTITTFVTHTCVPSGPAKPCDPTSDYFYRLGRGLPAVVEQRSGTLSLNFDARKLPHLITTVNIYPREVVYKAQGSDGRKVRRASLGETHTYLWEKQSSTSNSIDVLPQSFAGCDTTAKICPPDPDGSYLVGVDLPLGGKHLAQATGYDFEGNVAAVVDLGDVDNAQEPSIVTWINNLDPVGDATGWIRRPFTTDTGYGDKVGQMTGAPWRSFAYSWGEHGTLDGTSAALSGTVALTRVADGAPAPSDASMDGNNIELEKIFRDDQFGNATEILAPNGRCTSFTYDPDYHQFPETVTVHRNGCDLITGVPRPAGDVPDLVTTTHFDRGLGVVTSRLSPSDELTVWVYDGFGRLIEVDQNDANIPGVKATVPALTIDYSKAMVGPVRKVQTMRYNANTVNWTYLDGFGRTLASLNTGNEFGTWIVDGLVHRTRDGRVDQAFEPTVFGPAPYHGDEYSLDTPTPAHFSRYSYDALGRLVTSTGLDGNTTTQVYHNASLSVDVIDPEQAPGGLHAGSFTTFTLDGHGRLASIAKHFATDPIVDTVTANFSYAPTGEVTARAESRNGGEPVTHNFVYDSLGRMVQSLEPNSTVVWAGPPNGWTYAYNDNGNLVGTSDARGCGKNIVYDMLGRLWYEDYSPCTPEQEPYSKPVFNWPLSAAGFGIERLNIYDTPVGPSNLPPKSYLGRLTGTADRGQSSTFEFDARGRVTHVRRQLAVPGAGSAPFATRYAPYVFEQAVTYDEADRQKFVTSGASAPELAPAGTGSWFVSNYDPRGNAESVESSYGELLGKQVLDAFGSVTEQDLGDAAHTIMKAVYDGGRPTMFSIKRGPGPWLSASANYTLPAANTATLQGVLTDLTIGYDHAGTPLTVYDWVSPGSFWPLGALPAVKKTMTYYDSYRLKSVDVSYLADNDFFFSPILGVDTNFPPVAGPANGLRLRSESFTYDWMGNTTSADDSDHVPDRSPGTLIYAAPGPHQATYAFQNGTTVVPTYDAAGNITSMVVSRSEPCDPHPCTEIYTYTWDEVGRLSTAKRAFKKNLGSLPITAASVAYAYDGGGSRVLKSVTDSNDKILHTAEVFPTLRLEGAKFDGDFQHDASTERVLMPVGPGVLARAQVALNDKPSNASRRTRVFFEFGDQLGSTSFVIDKETSELVERATYQAFGRTESDYRPDRWNNFREIARYTGKTDDAEVGVVYFGARYYAAMLGRWMSPDPLAVNTPGGDMNSYGFVGGQPTLYTDPDGLQEEIIINEISGEISGGAAFETVGPPSGGCLPDQNCIGRALMPEPGISFSGSSAGSAGANVPEWLSNYMGSAGGTSANVPEWLSNYMANPEMLGGSSVSPRPTLPTALALPSNLLDDPAARAMTLRDEPYWTEAPHTMSYNPLDYLFGQPLRIYVTPQVMENSAASPATGAARAAQLILNRIAGNAFRDTLAVGIRATGRDVATEVYKWTPTANGSST